MKECRKLDAENIIDYMAFFSPGAVVYLYFLGYLEFLSFSSLFFYSFNAYICLSISSITSAAKTKPIIAEPEIHGSHSLDNVTGFLLLMSEGLVLALESAHGPEQVNQVSILFFVCIFSVMCSFPLQTTYLNHS